MPTSLTIRLRGEEEHQHGSYLASLMQGVLMEKIDPVYAEYLHMTGAHPYSQNIQVKDNLIYWNVNALSDEAEQHLIQPLLNNDDPSFFLSHRQETLKVIDKSIKKCSYDELVHKYYFGSNSRNLTLQFLTPAGFKQGGRYCIFPTGRLIFQSLMQRYDAGAEDSSIFSEELVEEFEQYTEIIDYKLRSVRFSMEGVKIPSFVGECTIRIRGPQQMVNVAHMLAHYGEFSGVGIKTGLGMGALSVRENPFNNMNRKTKETSNQMQQEGKRGE